MLQVQQELSDLESKALLIEKIMNESREIQDFTRYPLIALLPFFHLNILTADSSGASVNSPTSSWELILS